ncbi:MAG: prepilin-type N-terminal cleavage/methylation domain-containing protein [Dehalococcoidia bacterium]
MRWLRSRLKRLLRGRSPGFTLVEVVVSVGILSLAMGLVVGGLFQALGIQRFWFDDVVATKDLRHASSWFASDALTAESTDLVDGAPPAEPVTLTWIDDNDVPHTVTYSLVGSSLMRDFDGTQITLARRVVSAGFALSGKVLTFDLEVEADRGGTESVSLQTYLRMSQ